MEYLVITIGIIVDQLTKYFAQKFLYDAPIEIIKEVFSFTLVKNYNGAFGMFGGINSFLLPISLIISLLCFWLMRKAKKSSYRLLSLAVALIIAGAVGNIIDRVFHGYVIDFIRVHLFDFPVFNMADIFVVVGAFSAGILLCFTKAGDIFENNK